MPAHPSEFDEPMLRRLEEEMDAYTQWMKERAEEVYMIAERARSLGLDPQDVVEIPRAQRPRQSNGEAPGGASRRYGGGLIDPRRSR